MPFPYVSHQCLRYTSVALTVQCSKFISYLYHSLHPLLSALTTGFFLLIFFSSSFCMGEMEVNDIEGKEGRNFNDGAIQNGDIKANDEEK